MPRTIAVDCPGCPPIKALTFDVLGLIKIIESRSIGGNQRLATTPKIVDRWGEPDAPRCILSASINDRKFDPAYFIDLDMKPLKKMPYYYDLDQKIVSCHTEMQKVHCGPPENQSS